MKNTYSMPSISGKANRWRLLGLIHGVLVMLCMLTCEVRAEIRGSLTNDETLINAESTLKFDLE